MKTFAVAVAVAALSAACGTHSAQSALPVASGHVSPIGKTRHIVYLHGKIVQEQGTRAISPKYGPYLFDAIVEELGRNGARVHAPVRTGKANTEESARDVVLLVRELMASGVPADSITVVGASLGAIIAIRTSVAIENPSLRYVLLGACNAFVRDELKPDLHGHVLSIYEESDPYGGTCRPVAEGKPGVTSFDEVRLTTGLSHGFLYRPLPGWVEPTLRWSTWPARGEHAQADVPSKAP